jgi:hypothetical protein
VSKSNHERAREVFGSNNAIFDGCRDESEVRGKDCERSAEIIADVIGKNTSLDDAYHRGREKD